MDERAQNVLKQLLENARTVEIDPDRQRMAAAEETEKAKKAVENWGMRIKTANIPLRYKSCSFDVIKLRGVPQDCRTLFKQAEEYADHFGEYAKEGRGLIFAGSPGRLKTTLAVAVMQKVMRDGKLAYFISMPELLDTLMSLSQNRDREELVKFEEKIRNVGLLVLDDFGAEYPSGWVLNKVDAIITARYNNLKPIVITTNLRPDEMKERYVARVIDRLRSAYVMVIAEGESLRDQSAVVRA